MAVATRNEQLEGEERRVVMWRAEELERAGYPKRVAGVLAVRKDVDLHFAVALLRKGCPQETALRILL